MDTLRTLGPKIWNIIPSELSNSVSLLAFKDKIKRWIPANCPCRLCQNYVELTYQLLDISQYFADYSIYLLVSFCFILIVRHNP